jgi:hypothetical protein
MFSSGGMGGGNSGSGLAGFLGGLFGDSGAPYEDAMNQYREWANKAQGAQNPFLQAGTGAIPQFQEWLQGQKDPSGFINNLMGKYQESPWAKYQQDQAMRAAQNMGSATGLTGSTPLTQFAQQQAGNISSQDMQNWLQRVLGINSQYGAGQQSLMQGGQNAANALTNMYGDMGRQMGEASAYKRAGEQYDTRNMWGGLFNMGLHGLFGG